MTDELILRLVDETSRVLARMEFFMPCRHLVPSYNALVRATQVNHPEDPYLNSAFPLLDASEKPGHVDKHGGDASAITPPQLRILFTQLRIILESLQEEPVPSPGSGPDNRPAEDVDIYRELYRSEGKQPTRERAEE